LRGVHRLCCRNILCWVRWKALQRQELEDEYGVISGLVARSRCIPPRTLVVKDLADIVEGRPMQCPLPKKPGFGFYREAERRYYLRFSVANHAGCWPDLQIFWKYNISIAGVIQKEPVSTKFVPIVMTTYLPRKGHAGSVRKWTNCRW